MQTFVEEQRREDKQSDTRQEDKKADKKAEKFSFIGYTEITGNHKVWDEVIQKCFVRHDPIFNEAALKCEVMFTQQHKTYRILKVSTLNILSDSIELYPDSITFSFVSV